MVSRLLSNLSFNIPLFPPCPALSFHVQSSISNVISILYSLPLFPPSEHFLMNFQLTYCVLSLLIYHHSNFPPLPLFSASFNVTLSPSISLSGSRITMRHSRIPAISYVSSFYVSRSVNNCLSLVSVYLATPKSPSQY